jgi:PAS domain S-box-containing protein
MGQSERIRVLLAEDVASDAELEVRELKRAGMRIEHRLVESEEQFRLELERFSPHVILSDFSMPHFDGMAALALARETAPGVPFIFVSGTIGEEYAIRALKNGATDYVLKTNLIRLPAAVERALQEARERAEKRETERALETTRQRLESIFRSLPDVVWSVALPERRLIYVSPAVAQVYGLTPQEALAAPGFWIDAMHPEDRERVMAQWPGSPAGKVHDAEYRIVRRDGVVRWVNVRRRVITNAAGVPERVDGLVRDITDAVGQRERLARLSRIRDLLGAANAAFMRIRDRDEMYADFCHIAVTRGGFVLARVVALDESGRLRIAAAGPAGDAGAFARIVEDYNRDPQGARSLLAQVLRTGQREVSNDVRADKRVAYRADLTAHANYALALLPVHVENAVTAVAILRAREPGYFDHAELELLRELIANLEFALELQGKREKVDYLALYDALTGLPNRKLLRERLAQAIDARRHRRQGGPGAAGHRALQGDQRHAWLARRRPGAEDGGAARGRIRGRARPRGARRRRPVRHPDARGGARARCWPHRGGHGPPAARHGARDRRARTARRAEGGRRALPGRRRGRRRADPQRRSRAAHGQGHRGPVPVLHAAP